MKKTYAPKNTSVKALLEGVRQGKYYVDDICRVLRGRGWWFTIISLATAWQVYDYNKKYTIQRVTVPEIRGNLSTFSNKKVKIISLGRYWSTQYYGGAKVKLLIKSA